MTFTELLSRCVVRHTTLWLVCMVYICIVKANAQISESSSQCRTWQSVSDALGHGQYSTNETVCARNQDCSGYFCKNLIDGTSAAATPGSLISFGVEVDECSYPLRMSVFIQYSTSGRFNQTITIQTSGSINYSLPSFDDNDRVIRLLCLKWVSVLKPIRYHINLEANYTTLSRSGLPGSSRLSDKELDPLRKLELVPGVSVPVSNCRSLFDTTTKHFAPPTQSATSPIWDIIMGFTTDTPNNMPDSVTPLVIAGVVVVLLLVLLLVVLLHRHRLAARLTHHRRGVGSFRHTKLRNDDYITDDHVLPI